MPKKISDEKLIESLLIHGGVAGAAKACGISRNAIYKRMQDSDFKTAYNAAQGVVLASAASSMAGMLCEVVDALLSVVRDDTANANTRVSAADSLLRHCVRYVELATVCARLEAVEKKIAEAERNEH